ncbi:MAG: DUF4382 domain-containing protein [Gammaproteobacteria bacterium]|nr:DUF4382 domain-containing protein [Gammaproteobacteria bacterium]MDH3750087.1 DUF4382 domain-containing protein [Gammaproteobacteria bacterium]
MTTFTKRSGIGLVCILAVALAACSGSGSGVEDQSQPTPPSTGDTGYFNLSISDAPIKDAAKVCIRFDGVELKHANSDERETIDFDQPEVVNLLANQGANSHPIVTGAEVPAGEYEWIRLKVQAERDLSGGANDGDPTSELCDDETENSYLVRDSGGVFNLFIPSGSQRGLQLIKDIIIPVNRTGDYTAEWDLGKSFNGPPGLLPDVMMKPVVKLVANNEVGTLVGGVADELIAWEACDAEFSPSVYVFDDGVEPNPFDDPFAVDDAVATGLVEQQMQEDGSTPWRYSIGFLLAGNYEVAYTCNGDLFAPLAGKPAEILLEEVTTVDFLAEDAPGSLVGQVDSVFFDPDAPESGFCDATFTPMVYVFEDGVEPSFAVDAVATGEVGMDMTTEQYGYSIPLQAANYNAAFTCTGTDFIPAAGKPAEILPGAATMVDFLAEDAPPPVGSLSGEVATELAEAASCTAGFVPAVYVFEEGVTPNATDEPVTTGPVTMDMTTEAYGYLIENLLADTYTAAFTCTGTDFVPVDGKEAVIAIGEVTPLNFDAEDAPAS